jgi:hypothetical protein
MHGVSQLRRWLMVALLACAAHVFADDARAPVFAPVAHSALIALTAARGPSGVTLHLERAAGAAPLSVTGLTASVDGKNLPVTPLGNDSWSLASPPAGVAGDGRLEVTVIHDGIREVLSGALPTGAADTAARSGAGGSSLLHNHKQLAWWILNIGVVLIAVLAISRRMS